MCLIIGGVVKCRLFAGAARAQACMQSRSTKEVECGVVCLSGYIGKLRL